MTPHIDTTDHLFFVLQRRARQHWLPRGLRLLHGAFRLQQPVRVSSSGRAFSSLELRWLDTPAWDRRRENRPEFNHSTVTADQRLQYFENLLFNLQHRPKITCDYRTPRQRRMERAA